MVKKLKVAIFGAFLRAGLKSFPWGYRHCLFNGCLELKTKKETIVVFQHSKMEPSYDREDLVKLKAWVVKLEDQFKFHPGITLADAKRLTQGRAACVVDWS